MCIIKRPQCTSRFSTTGNRNNQERLTGSLLHMSAYFSILSDMRTTIEISDELCRQLKRKAADEGVTIRQVVYGKQNEVEYYPAFDSTTATSFFGFNGWPTVIALDCAILYSCSGFSGRANWPAISLMTRMSPH